MLQCIRFVNKTKNKGLSIIKLEKKIIWTAISNKLLLIIKYSQYYVEIKKGVENG